MATSYHQTDVKRLKFGGCGGIMLALIVIFCPPLAIFGIVGALIYGLILAFWAGRDKTRFGVR